MHHVRYFEKSLFLPVFLNIIIFALELCFKVCGAGIVNIFNA